MNFWKEKQELKIAMYMRISEADDDIGVDYKDESNSIENQRLLLYSYVESNDEFADAVEEYVDDGYSGTNFERPSFQRMLEDAKQGKIHTILVKDLSRLGRDYVMVGDYIEQIFPMLNVRFIAVNSHYDSNKAGHNSNMDFDMAVSNMINTMYSRDLSKKMRSAHTVIWKNGRSTSGNAPYGYVNDPENKGKWLIDPEAGKVIKMIFEFAVSGWDSPRIAHYLNDNHIPTPMVYNETHNSRKPHSCVTTQSERLWTSAIVTPYLQRYEYTGALVIGRSQVVAIGSKNCRRRPEDQWTVVEGVNEGIITVEEYEQAQKVIRRRKMPAYVNSRNYALKGKARCGNCRCCLDFVDSGSEDYFVCSRKASAGNQSKCTKEKYPASILNQVVYEALREHLEILKTCGLVGEQRAREEIINIKHKMTERRGMIDRLKAEKVRQYEFYADGHISKESYLKKKQELTNQIEQLQERGKSVEEQFSKNKEILAASVQMTELCEEFGESQKLTKNMADAFISNVYVHDIRNIEIEFRFEDKVAEIKSLFSC
jgi:DNA invertase Pin-like site-specific DNA recombinase